MWASTHGRGDMAARLLATGAKHDLYDDKGAEALHNATQHEQLGAMGALLRAGANPNCGRSGVGNGLYIRGAPLHMAVALRRFKAAKVLLCAGALADVKDFHGMTPLHCAVSDGYTEMVFEMLSHIRRRDFDLVSSGGHGLSKANNPSTADQQQSRRQRQQQQYRGDWSTAGPGMHCVLSARDDQGWTALHVAAMLYNVDMANLLLRYGALETEKDTIRETPFLYLVRCVQGGSIRAVLHHHKDVVPDVARAYRIVQSLSRARAARAQSWRFPDAAASSATASAPEGPVVGVAAQSSMKRQHATAVHGPVRVLRLLRVTRNKRSSVFLRAVRGYIQTKGHVVLEDGQVLTYPGKTSMDQAAAWSRYLALV